MSEEQRRHDDRGRGDGRRSQGREAEARRATELALLRLSGEVGYQQASVAVVLGRSGWNLTSFYRAYSGKAACYAAAYDSAATALCARLLAACKAAPDWPAAMKTGLLELSAYTAEDPALAAGLLVEVHVADGAALERRAELVARLARAVDRGRQATRQQSPPRPVTPVFVVEAIEAAVARSLADGTPLREALPGLLFIAVASYFDASEAARQVRGWPEER
jgi:AcrR family transcriptional regulator